MVDVETITHGFFPIIFTLHKRFTGNIVGIGNCRGVVFNVINSP